MIKKKKIISIVLAVVMILSFAINTSAESVVCNCGCGGGGSCCSDESSTCCQDNSEVGDITYGDHVLKQPDDGFCVFTYNRFEENNNPDQNNGGYYKIYPYAFLITRGVSDVEFAYTATIDAVSSAVENGLYTGSIDDFNVNHTAIIEIYDAAGNAVISAEVNATSTEQTISCSGHNLKENLLYFCRVRYPDGFYSGSIEITFKSFSGIIDSVVVTE